MSTSLPPEIRVTELADGVRYRLPRRGLGCATLTGLVVALFGFFCAAGAVGGLLGAFVIGRQGSLVGAVVIGLLFCAPILVLGLFLLLSGLWLLFGHTELRLADGRIVSLLKIGPLTCFARRRASADVQRLVLVSDNEQKGPVLAAACVGARPVELATLYPYDWLWYLGQDLAGRLQASAESQALELEEEWTDFTGERPVQPALSRIAVEESEEGTLFRVPAAGWRDPGPLVLLFVGSTFAAVALTLALTIPANQGIVLLIGLLPTLGLLLGAVTLARRHVLLAVRDDTLVLTRIGLFTHVRSWRYEELTAVRAVRELRKQTTTDQQGHTHRHWAWVEELQIHSFQGRPVVLSGRYGMLGRTAPQEWEWLATALRQALDVPA
jgi:hypothetical protein